MNYPINIPSVAHIHPALVNDPDVANNPVLQGLFSNSVAGTPLNPLALVEAEETAQTVTAAASRLPQVLNTNVVQTTRNRMHLLRGTHASMELGDAPGFAGLQQFLQQNLDQMNTQMNTRFNQLNTQMNTRFNQLDTRFNELDTRFNHLEVQMNTRFNHLEAVISNIRIVSRNQAVHFLNRPDPLQKYVPGDGHALALPLAVNAALAQAIQQFQPEGVVGSVPPHFNPDIDTYQHLDILQLIVFYNDAFGINVGDPLPERKNKIRNWLVVHMA